MSDKLTASVAITGIRFGRSQLRRAHLRNDTHCFDVGPQYSSDQDTEGQARVQGTVDRLTEAIQQHDKAVNASLLKQRDYFKAMLVGVHETLSSRGFVEAAADLQAAIAEAENSDD